MVICPLKQRQCQVEKLPPPSSQMSQLMKKMQSLDVGTTVARIRQPFLLYILFISMPFLCIFLFSKLCFSYFLFFESMLMFFSENLVEYNEMFNSYN